MSDNSDSSEEENIELLKEAIDTSLIKDSFFTNTGDTPVKEETALKSLRKQTDDEDNQFNYLKVTPEFRKHVAKHLEKILEEWLKKHVIITDNGKKKRKRLQGGIRLLSCSRDYVNADKYNDKDEITQHNKNAKHVLNNKFNPELLDIKSIVVDGKHILSGAEIKNWAKKDPCKKNYVYKKSKNNVLYFIEKPSKYN